MRISDWSSDVCSSDLHGTTTATRLLVIDKVPAADPSLLPASHGEAPDLATLLAWVTSHVPPRPAQPAPAPAATPRSEERRVGKASVRTCRSRWSPET